MIYVLVFVAVVIATIFSWKRKNTFLYFSICFLLFCVSSFRDESVGTDTWAYVEGFVDADSQSGYFFISPELLYQFFLYYIRLFSKSYLVFFILSYLLIYSTLTYAIKRFSTNWMLSLCVFTVCYPFFFLQSLNVMRQMMALPFVLLFICYWNEGRKKISVLFLIIATLFHFISFVSVIFVLLASIRHTLSRSQLFLVLLFSFFIGCMGGLPIGSFFENIPGIGSANNTIDFLSGKVDRYSNYSETNNLNSFIFSSIPLLFYTLTLFKYRVSYPFFFNLLFIMTVCNMLFNQSMSNMDRILLSPLSVLIIFIPNALARPDVIFEKRLISLGLILMTVYYFYIVFFMNLNIYPYKFS